MRLSTILLTILVIGAGVLVIGAMRQFAAEPPAAEKREPEVTVAVQDVAIASHRPRISVIGMVEAKDEALLTSPLDTEVLEVFAEEGDAVESGTRLVALDTRETNFQLEAQLAGIDDINAQLEALQLDLGTERRRTGEIANLKSLAADELRRNLTLLERGVVAQAAVDQARAAVSARDLELLAQRQKIDALQTSRKRLQASLRGAEAQVGQLRLVLERARIEAPFSGIVKTMNPSQGTRVARGSPLVQLYDPETLRIRAAIPNEHSAAATGGRISGEIATAAGTVPAPMVSVSPEAKPGRGSVDALFELPGGRWLLGTAIEIDLVLPAESGTLAVPFDALYSGSRVYVVGDESRAVAVDCEGAGQTVIDGRTLALLRCPGLAGGERIVVNRVPNLVSGTKLKAGPA